jgi:hypothetical protein
MHMTIKNRWTTTTALAVALPLWLLAGGAALAAPPRSGSTTVTRTGPAGNTATRQTNVSTNGHGGYTAGSTVTGPAGNTASRQQSGSYNAATQTYTRSGTSTGPNGKQSSFNTSVQATGNGYNRTATRTGPNGATATKTSSVTTTPPSN